MLLAACTGGATPEDTGTSMADGASSDESTTTDSASSSVSSDGADSGQSDGEETDTTGSSMHPDAPEILVLSTNVNELTEGENVVVSAVVTDPDGVDDVIGGLLESPDGAISYGAFQTSGQEGSYELTLNWTELDVAVPIEFESETAREMRAVFFDQAGHETSGQVDLTLHCSGEPACGGTCVELNAAPCACDAQCTGRCGEFDFCMSETQTLYVNFDGGDFTLGEQEDAWTNTVTFASHAGSHAPYSGNAPRTEIVHELRELFLPVGLEVTDERPAEGDYTMIVVSGPVFVDDEADCGNTNPRDIQFVPGFLADSATDMAMAIAFWAGYAYGLEQSTNDYDTMSWTWDLQTSFLDDCVSLSGGGSCGSTHEQFCPPGQQNSHAELWAAIL